MSVYKEVKEDTDFSMAFLARGKVTEVRQWPGHVTVMSELPLGSGIAGFPLFLRISRTHC